jgi:hypothetical protein
MRMIKGSFGFIAAILFFFSQVSLAGIIVIEVQEKTSASPFKACKTAETAARKKAVRQYIQDVSPKCDPEAVQRLVSEHPKYVLSVIRESCDVKGGVVTGSFSVELDDDKLRQDLEKRGYGSQGGRRIVILEEPPSKASMQFGTVHVRYTDYQRRIRDAIVRKANERGLKIQLLADMPEFDKYKSDDETLVGVYYDVDTADFVINRGLLRKISETMPGVLAFYYRIDNLYIDEKTKVLKAVISISIKNLDTGETKAAGAQSYSVKLMSNTAEARVDAFSVAAENATALLMNRAKNIIDRWPPPDGRPKESSFIIQLSSTRTLYDLKKALAPDKRVKNPTVESGRFTFKLEAGIQPADFVFETLYPAFDKLGLKIPEEKVLIKGNEVRVTQ